MTADSTPQPVIDLLRSMGATDDDVADPAFEPTSLAVKLSLLPEPDTLTTDELAVLAGTTPEHISELRLALGATSAEPDEPVASSADATNFASLVAAEAFFGPAAIQDLARVIGLTTSRLSEAIISSFLVNVGRQFLGTDDELFDMTKANAAAADFMPLLLGVIDRTLRRHIVESGRSTDTTTPEGSFEIQELAVGFIDLVGSTELTDTLSFEDAGEMFHQFDHITTRTIAGLGGRVVKLIGDEVMFESSSLEGAIRIGQAVIAGLAAVADMPATRCGIVHGPVLLRDGDLYGSTVNMAARLVSAAAPGTMLVVPEPTTSASTPIGGLALRGIAEPATAWKVERAT